MAAAILERDGVIELPEANVIVNPNQPGCGFDSKALAGVGVMFYVASQGIGEGSVVLVMAACLTALVPRALRIAKEPPLTLLKPL